MPLPSSAPQTDTITADQPDQLPTILQRFDADRGALNRRYDIPWSPQRRARLAAFFGDAQRDLEALPYERLGRSDRVDFHLFRGLLERECLALATEARQFTEIEPLVPFASALIKLEEDRRSLLTIDAALAAKTLDISLKELTATRDALVADMASGESAPVRPSVAGRAAKAVKALITALEEWYAFYDGYDPLFTWWSERPYRALVEALSGYAEFLHDTVAGATGETVLGDPIGREALVDKLAFGQIAYSPEELIAMGYREFAWGEAELKKASAEMGLGDDWRAALERVKDSFVAPGAQPGLIRDLATEAIAYLDEHDLVTIPSVARDCYRIEMMPAERQKVSPFFLGGEAIWVSYPVAAMEHDQKRMSLRGNNPAFARATVQHELIPGHHLQMFSMERYKPYRQIFYTPFWIEGWTIHWEMLLWERGFGRTPEEKIGMLFWRQHRAARVIFSLRFHLGEMSAAECIEMLVNDVGHERDNAAAEVRRSFEGDYGALYQCAYQIGGMQVHSLYREMTAAGLTDRHFHDAFLAENTMPITLLRALMTGAPIEREFAADWRFLDGWAR